MKSDYVIFSTILENFVINEILINIELYHKT